MSDHLIQVRYTKDAGNWTAFRDLNAGRVGAFGQELVTRQLGQATARSWEICDTSPFAADLLSAAIQADYSGNWSDFPLPDGSYSDLTRDWTLQDVENYIPLPAQQAGTRSRALYRTAPGLEVVANIGAGPHRGAISVEGTLFVVSGTALYEVASDGTATSRGTIPGTGRVCIAYNQITDGNQLVVGNGSSGYVYNTVTGAFTQITDDGFVGFKSCDFLNQYIVGVEPLGRFWYHSDLVDALSYNTLDRYGAETSPDAIQGLIASHNEVLVFGARTIEPWVNDPENNAAGTAFQLQRGSVIERGCINGNTIRRLDNSVFFVGDDRVPYRLNGYTPVPIGTPVLAAAWRDLNPSKAFAFTYEDRGHVVYYVTWGDGQTWGYDVVTGKWHRRQSFGLNRWRLNSLVKWGNEWYGGDFQNGKFYRLAWGFVYEGCEIMPRRIRTGVLHADGNPVSVAGFKVVASTGGVDSVVSAAEAPTISGALPGGIVGTAVDYTYTITRAFVGQVVTLSISGDWPPGLSIDGNGHVTGTLEAAGDYYFTITPSSECAQGVPLTQFVSATTVTFPPLSGRLGWVSSPTSGQFGRMNIAGTNALALGNAASGVTLAVMFDTPGNGGAPAIYLSTGTSSSVYRAALSMAGPTSTKIRATGQRVSGDSATVVDSPLNYASQWAMAIATFDYVSGVITLHVDGQQVATGAMTSGLTSATNCLSAGMHPGSSSPTRGADTSVYPGVLSQTQIDKLFGYMAENWNLRSKLPAGHPYKTASVNGFIPNSAGARIWYYSINPDNTMPVGYVTGGSISVLHDASGHGNDAVALDSTNYLTLDTPLSPFS